MMFLILKFLLLYKCFLVHVSASCSGPSNVPPPSKVFDLSNFKLQIPEGSDGTSIKDLSTYSSCYFYTDPSKTNTVNFWTPEDGNSTKNGSGPRTELSENKEFTFFGKHSMNFTQTVFEADPKGEICIGQIKGDSFSDIKSSKLNFANVADNATLTSSSCLIVVELIFNANSRSVTAHFRDKDCNSKTYSLGKYALSEPIKMTFVVDGVHVYVSSDKVTLPKYSYSFWANSNYQMHFKVGTYVQGHGSDHSKGAKSKLSQLEVSHS